MRSLPQRNGRPKVRRLPVAYRSEAQSDLLDIFRTVLRLSQNVATARGFVQRIKDRSASAPVTRPTAVVRAMIWSLD